MIYLFSDYSITDPYVGLMKNAIHQIAPDCKLLDVCHDLPVFNPQASSRLLQKLVLDIPEGSIILAVVDPGVGTDRLPLWLELDGRYFVGPDNGLFARIINQAKTVSAHMIEYDIKAVSASFHGRDIFAPAAAHLECGMKVASFPVKPENLVGKEWRDDLSEIIYIDHYGNAMTGIEAKDVSQQQSLKVNELDVSFARTFDNELKDKPFWYANSLGLIEVAQSKASVAELYQINIGDKVRLESP
ncbi:MAG: SAM-dependent chlorinase/fluorinase [Pseudomonadota bacterium]